MSQAIIEQKKVAVEDITSKMTEALSTVVVEYRGLTVAQVTELRTKLREENVEFKVYKNNLARRAAEKAGYSELVESLTGPNAIAFGIDDAVSPARVLSEFAKNHDALVIKSGVIDGKVISESELKVIATLPNKEGMLSMLLSCLQSPVRSFALAVKAVADAGEAN